MRAVRHLIWPAGLVLIVLVVPAVRSNVNSTYGGAFDWLLWLEAGAAIALTAAGALEATDRRRVALLAAGVLWLVPELAGVSTAPDAWRTVADATARLLPALVTVAVFGVVATGFRWRVPVAIAAVAGGLIAAGVRALAVDPFIDPRCWRLCGHNPLLVGQVGEAARGLERVALGLTVVAAATALAAVLVEARRRPSVHSVAGAAAVTALVLGSTLPAVLWWVTPENPGKPQHVALFTVAQVGAIGLGAAVATTRLREWRLSARLARLADSLRSAPAAGALAGALGRAVGDDRLRIRYWVAERGGYVDADGNAVGEPTPTAQRGVTQVARHGSPLAAFVHSAGIDGDQLDRALRPALRLALENERLRAAVLAELREVQSSRVRIVERAEEERQRLERNLHDGAQQRVASLFLLVRMLRNRVAGGGAAQAAASAETLTRATLEELRRVARGIYPAVLADAGLAGGVMDLAESSTDVAIDVRHVPAGRYKGIVETTAYLVVAAAVADARSRSATAVSVSAAERDGRLVVEATDDAAPASDGVIGPADVLDQVGALGGRILVEATASGTRVRLELPCG